MVLAEQHCRQRVVGLYITVYIAVLLQVFKLAQGHITQLVLILRVVCLGHYRCGQTRRLSLYFINVDKFFDRELFYFSLYRCLWLFDHRLRLIYQRYDDLLYFQLQIMFLRRRHTEIAHLLVYNISYLVAPVFN